MEAPCLAKLDTMRVVSPLFEHYPWTKGGDTIISYENGEALTKETAYETMKETRTTEPAHETELNVSIQTK